MRPAPFEEPPRLIHDRPAGSWRLPALPGRVIAFLVAASMAVAVSMSPAALAQSVNLPPGAAHVQRVDIIDPNGFGRPMPAASILLPVGWRAQGGVVWNTQDLCNSGFSVNWQAQSPDGASRVAITPAAGWTTNNFGATGGQCPNRPYTTVRAYLESLVPQLGPNARALDFRPREDLRRQFAALESHTPMPTGELRSWVEAGELLVAFEENGRAMRGTIASIAHFSYNRFNGALGNAPMESLSGATFPGFAASAPAGRLDMRLTEAIRASVKPSPEWSQRINEHRAVLNRNALAGARKRSEITTRTSEEIRQIQQKGWERRMETQDRMHRKFTESIREVQTFRDPDAAGGSIELSNHYANAWRLNDGTYVLSDDSSLNPYAVTGQDGRRLEVMR